MPHVALITVHGMGSTPPDYAAELQRELAHRLGPRAGDVHVGSVWYQGILEPNERRVWDRVGRSVRWDDLRKFLLFGFADAAGLESGRHLLAGAYTLAQIHLARTLYEAYRAVGPDGRVVWLAQSLGGQVSSNYFWDAGSAAAGKPAAGIWADIHKHQTAISGNEPLSTPLIRFLQGATLEVMLTTGCNIPIFVAAHATQDILPIRPNPGFRWLNFYDKDDVLGWPLADLSSEYAQVVRDIPVNAGGGLLGWLVKSWNPMSHTQYWRDDEVLDPLEHELRRLLP